jgi:hypothetical protein
LFSHAWSRKINKTEVHSVLGLGREGELHRRPVKYSSWYSRQGRSHWTRKVKRSVNKRWLCFYLCIYIWYIVTWHRKKRNYYKDEEPKIGNLWHILNYLSMLWQNQPRKTILLPQRVVLLFPSQHNSHVGFRSRIKEWMF